MIRFLSLIAVLLLLSLPLRAQEAEIRGVISDQITAFQSDDFETAFTFASPGIRQMFGTPGVFGEMVRNGYPMVHRPQSYAFQGLRQQDGRLFQDVLIEGPDGYSYMAEYDMVMTGQGWKIRGVRIVRVENFGV